MVQRHLPAVFGDHEGTNSVRGALHPTSEPGLDPSVPSIRAGDRTLDGKLQ